MKKIIIYSIVLFCLSACELTNVLENDPPNNLVSENVVENEADARALLNGIYTTITARTIDKYYLFTELIPSALIGTMSRVGGGTPASNNGQFGENDLQFDNTVVRDFWLVFYQVINGANNTITRTGELPESEISEASKREIIGEAHFLRAMATFDALRYYGQFFDENSSFGIILRTEPADFTTRNKARSTVAESYAQILADLDIAIADAPDYTVSYRASKTAAKALKAKVQLYRRQYADAATLAAEVINEGATSLEPTYAETFSEGLNSSEMIFMTYRDENSDSEDNNRKRFYAGRPGTTWFPDLMAEDPRQPITYDGIRVLKTNDEDTFRPTYFLRLAQMYLIQAEALAFSGAATLEESKIPLNIIRNRAGIGDSEATTMDELKDDIFDEIVKELAFENGSDWFAAIRFDKAMTLKPQITSSNQYILPIPEEEINSNSLVNLADQNPGYDGI